MKKLFVVGIALIFLFSAKTFAAEFSDVERTQPNYVAITYLTEIEVLKGYADGSYQPEKIMNRVEALKVILEGAGVEISEDLSDSPFSDVPGDQWYTKYVLKAKELGIVNGNPDGTFEPGRQVKRVEFVKMLLETNKFKKEKWENQQYFSDVPQDAWYAPYMNYAGKSGLLLPNNDNQLLPELPVSRGEMAEVLYLMKIILKGYDTQFLLSQGESQMAQIEIYIGAKDINSAKRAAELGYDLTQQALKHAPENNIVLGAAKIAKAYDLLVDAFIAGINQDNEGARSLAEQTKVKATEAWEANNEVQPIARHIKDRADEILSQL